MTIAAILAVVFLATLIRSAFGFGEALIAVPLLALSHSGRSGRRWPSLVSITVAAVVLIQDLRKVHMGSAGWLILSTFVGIPLGLWLLITAPRGRRQGAAGRLFYRWILGVLPVQPRTSSS